MKRTLVVVAAVVGFAAAASASTLTVATDHGSGLYNVGEQVVLTVSGNAQGANAVGIIGRLNYDAPLTSFVSVTQSPMYGTSGPLTSGDGFSQVFNQISGSGNPVPPNTQTITSVLTLTADAVGIVNVVWDSTTDFFGDYGQPIPGTSFTINPAIPEPATAALVGLGLIGLVLGGKRRRA